MKKMGALLGALAMVLFAVGPALADHADLTILSPKDGETVKPDPNLGPIVVVQLEAKNFGIADFTEETATDEHVGHIHIQLDDQPYNTIHTAKPIFVYAGVKPGKHTLTVELVHNNHTPLTKRVVKKIGFRMAR